METKMTAIEWLANELQLFIDFKNMNIKWEIFEELIEQARDMETEQIMDAYTNNRHLYSLEEAEQYYQETYGK